MDIKFNNKSFLNLKNLFLIIKWYTTNDEYLITQMYVNSAEDSTNNFKINLFHSVDIGKIKKMNFFDFNDWFDKIRDRDYEYTINLKYYGFRLVFDKKSIFFKEEFLFPKYPWNLNYTKIWFDKKLTIDNWLFGRNRKLYYEYKKFMYKKKKKL